MPRGTVNTEPTRRELKSCPGGFVMLKQLPYGQMLTRRDRAMRYLQEVNPQAKPTDISKIQIDILNEATSRYDFQNCVVDHNIEDELGNKLDFSNPMTFDILDPRIGTEIEIYIAELNQEDFDAGLFTSQSEQLLTGTGSLSPEDEVTT